VPKLSPYACPDICGYCFQFDPGLGNKFVVRKVVNGAFAVQPLR
jgi:hypothetical protein